MSASAFTVDLGGSHVTAAEIVVDGERARVERRRSAVIDPHGSADAILDAVAGVMTGVTRYPVAWRLAVPGPFDLAEGIGRYRDVGKFEALDGVDIRAGLSARLAAGTTLRFANDADAYGVGEWAFGAGRRASRMICITLGTGVGSGWIVAGEPADDGPEVPRDGEAHFIEVDGRPIEETVSTRAIVERYRRASGSTATVREIAERTRAGDADAADALRGPMEALGAALRPWAERFRPDVLVVGGGMSAAWDLIGEPLTRSLGRPSVEVVPGALGEEAPLLGGASLELEHAAP
ncbi:ROK family protein [Pseudolysinimonas sp.]|uniref:ROK family protein n=1 Tax=Pseudolysinimonas sp. TaxID=2680009 RepID=UPI003F7D573A